MGSALVLLVYVATVAFGVPPLLARLTARGVDARLGLAAWLVAMLSALTGAAAVPVFLVGPAVDNRPHEAGTVVGAMVMCVAAVREVALFMVLTALVVAATVVVGTLARRYVCDLRRVRRSTRQHAATARLAGYRLPEGALVVECQRPAAYCLPGRPSTVVVTSAAVGVLEPAQLDVVIAHERAHLAGHHPWLTMFAGGLAGLLPGVPLFRRGAEEVARLVEMRADDVAARRVTRSTLVAALLAMGSGEPVPVATLGATRVGVVTRVQRLLDPPRRSDRVRVRLALITTMLGHVATLLLVIVCALVLARCVWAVA